MQTGVSTLSKDFFVFLFYVFLRVQADNNGKEIICEIKYSRCSPNIFI